MLMNIVLINILIESLVFIDLIYPKVSKVINELTPVDHNIYEAV